MKRIAILIFFIISFTSFSLEYKLKKIQKKYGNELSYATKNGLKIYNHANDEFKLESIWDKNNKIVLLNIKSKQKFSKHQISAILKDFCKNAKWEKKYISIGDRNAIYPYNLSEINMYFIDKNINNLALYIVKHDFNNNFEDIFEYSLIIMDKKIENYFDLYYEDTKSVNSLLFKLRCAYFLNSKKLLKSFLESFYKNQFKNTSKDKKSNIKLDLQYNNFYPRIKEQNWKIIYLTDKLKKILLDFLGLDEVIYNDINDKILNSTEEKLIKIQKKQFLSPYLNVWSAETGTWYLTTIPIIPVLEFNEELNRVTVPYYDHDIGDSITFKKIEGKWRENKNFVFHNFGKQITIKE